MLSVFLALTLVLTATRGTCCHNNVCTSFADYTYDKDNNTNCYYDPDMFLDVVSLFFFPEYLRCLELCH